MVYTEKITFHQTHWSVRTFRLDQVEIDVLTVILVYRWKTSLNKWVALCFVFLEGGYSNVWSVRPHFLRIWDWCSTRRYGMINHYLLQLDIFLMFKHSNALFHSKIILHLLQELVNAGSCFKSNNLIRSLFKTKANLFVLNIIALLTLRSFD